MSQHTKQTVWTVTKKIIFKLSNQKEEIYDKATLAKVRKTLGKPLSEATEIWPILFENLPEEFLSSYQQPSYEELAIYTALQLYALHQQGVSTSVMLDDSKPYENIGSALGKLRKEDDTTSIDRRFNTMITSSTFEELTYHLRHLISLLKVESPVIQVDYSGLANDLYWFLNNSQENVRLNWARAYYKQIKGEKNNDN